jgi:resolvase-like protein
VKIALYARVSTEEQTVEQQLDELRQIGTRQGWKIVAELREVMSRKLVVKDGLFFCRCMSHLAPTPNGAGALQRRPRRARLSKVFKMAAKCLVK